jgi:aminomethyltransferase
MSGVLNKTVLHAEHQRAGAKLVPFHGWDMPLHYGSQLEEHHQVRRGCGIFDVSHMRVVDVEGEGAAAFLSRMLTNDIIRLAQPGQAQYTLMLNDNGGILDDLIVYRRASGYRLVLNCGCADSDIAWLRQHLPAQVSLQVRSDLAILAIQGPQVFTYLAQMFDANFVQQAQQLKSFSSFEQQDLQIARTGYTGEIGVELILPLAQAIQVWQAAMRAQVAPIGLGARDTLRLEAGLNLYGQDMSEQFTPDASNVAWAVKIDAHDFIGKSALQAQRTVGIMQQLVGLQLLGKGVLRHGMVLQQQGVNVGEITSGSFSPTYGHSIALARVLTRALLPQNDQPIEVLLRGQLLPIQLLRPPFIKQGQWQASRYQGNRT